MTKYIIALLFPWLSFFLQKRFFNGLICGIFSISSMVLSFLLKEHTSGTLIFALRLTIALVLGFWALVSVHRSSEEKPSDKISELY